MQPRDINFERAFTPNASGVLGLHSSLSPYSPSLMTVYNRLADIPTYASTSPGRLKSLYSEFAPQKHSNPSSYTSNIEWWRRTLEAVTLHGWQPLHHAPSSVQDRLVLNAEEGVTFSERFRYEGVGRPLSLATVIVSNLLSGRT